MRIEILNSEQEALERIQQLRDRGLRENQLSVIHDVYREIPSVEDTTDVDTIEIREDERDESVFDRFVNWVSGRDTLDHLFDRFDVAERDQGRYHEAVRNGKILLAVEEDEDIADSHFRSAHVREHPGEGPYGGTTEPIDPFIGGTHYPDGTPATQAGDPSAGSAPEYEEGLYERDREERLIAREPDPEAERDIDRAADRMFDEGTPEGEYQEYRPRFRQDANEHLYSKDERDAYVTRGDGPDHLRIDEPNYVTEDDLGEATVRPQDSEQPDLTRISEDSLSDYSEPRFEKDQPRESDEYIHEEEPFLREPVREGEEHLRIEEENYVTDEEAYREHTMEEVARRDVPEGEHERIREQARQEELDNGRRDRPEEGEMRTDDLHTPGEPLFGDGPKPEGYDKDPIYEGDIFHSDEERIRHREQGMIHPDGELREEPLQDDLHTPGEPLFGHHETEPGNHERRREQDFIDPKDRVTEDSMLETEEERRRREDMERRRDEHL